ncbi:hypothetical protein K6V92_08310 [Cupriavidus respiraculi]|uniref:hypothetical protein n=1 Tax=Cupriavidus respiraculi TaxID=195930 RepID=UPI001C9864CF|nr:hypothetical protein [Cupriavidus respiraculi]MBY4946625.1 hypothetical protein [Cupriavidus respiraculi]
MTTMISISVKPAARRLPAARAAGAAEVFGEGFEEAGRMEAERRENSKADLRIGSSLMESLRGRPGTMLAACTAWTGWSLSITPGV